MKMIINVRQLRAHLQEVVQQVRKGSRFTVLYRSHPAFAIVPVNEMNVEESDLISDPLYQAGPVGNSESGTAARQHDEVLYK